VFLDGNVVGDVNVGNFFLFFFLAEPTGLALANQATPQLSGVLLRPRCLHLSPIFQDVHLVPLLGNGS
jgi:hypothetical protein